MYLIGLKVKDFISLSPIDKLLSVLEYVEK